MGLSRTTLLNQCRPTLGQGEREQVERRPDKNSDKEPNRQRPNVFVGYPLCDHGTGIEDCTDYDRTLERREGRHQGLQDRSACQWMEASAVM
jgi:hypothetical protein